MLHRLLPDRALWRRIFNRIDAEPGPVVLDRRRVFILPTRQGYLFALVLLLMLIGSINYELGLGLVLTFLLAGMALVSILHTWGNLAQLTVRAGRAAPVFAGQAAVFPVHLDNPGATSRFAVGLASRGQPVSFTDIAAGSTASLALRVNAERRGRLKPGPFTLFTQFPPGLFRAWSRLELETVCLVYPRPDDGRLPLPAADAAREGTRPAAGDDFDGLRPYRPGDSLRHVAWKAAARAPGLLTKQFSGRAGTEVWLDWEALSGMDAEARLSRLCRWVLDARAAGLTWGLRLPGKTFAPGGDELHYLRCLEALALFGSEGDTP